MANKEIRELLMKRQGYVSPMTGVSLDGVEVECHHIISKSNNGPDDIENYEMLPLPEHLAKHFRSFYFSDQPGENEINDFYTSVGRLPQLSQEQQKTFYSLLETQLGIKVRFIEYDGGFSLNYIKKGEVKNGLGKNEKKSNRWVGSWE